MPLHCRIEKQACLRVTNPGVTLLTWKRAEDGDGTILRLQETTGQASEVRIHSPYLTFEHAWLCDLLEENQVRNQNSKVEISVFRSNHFRCLLLDFAPAPRVRQGIAQ